MGNKWKVLNWEEPWQGHGIERNQYGWAESRGNGTR